MITMQASEGTIDELVGAQCHELFGVAGPAMASGVAFVMVRTDAGWFRFTIDVGVLFFAPSEDPATSGEVEDDDRIIDLLPEGGPFEIEVFRFQRGVLEVAFATLGRIRFHEDSETSAVVVDDSAMSGQ